MLNRLQRIAGLDRYSGLYLWALFIVIFGIWEPTVFLTMSTVHSVASEQAIVGMLSLAVLVPLVGNNYDLSVGAVANIATITVAWLQTSHHWPMWPAIALTIIISAGIGAINGLLVVRFRVNSFIATLGMATVVLAVQTIISGNSQPLSPAIASWSQLTQRSVGGFQIVFIYLIAIALIMYWILEHTPAGRYLHAIGGNSEAARLTGVNVGKWVWLSLICSATIAGIAGICFASLLGTSLSYGQGLLLPAFAAAFLGSTQLRPGRFNVWGTIIAVYVLATGVEGIQLRINAQWISGMFNGVALIVAVAFAVWRQRVRKDKGNISAREEDSIVSADSDLSEVAKV